MRARLGGQHVCERIARDQGRDANSRRRAVNASSLGAVAHVSRAHNVGMGSDTESARPTPKAFISYSWDSEAPDVRA